MIFFVPGFPETQGGMKPVPNPRTGRTVLVSTGSAGLAKWRQQVTAIAEANMMAQRAETERGPVRLHLRFYLPMPESRPAASRHDGWCHSTVKPDIDKLERAVLDALKVAGVYLDDAQVVSSAKTKCEVYDHTLCGVEIMVLPVDPYLLQSMASRRRDHQARVSPVAVAQRSTRRRARAPRPRG